MDQTPGREETSGLPFRGVTCRLVLAALGLLLGQTAGAGDDVVHYRTDGGMRQLAGEIVRYNRREIVVRTSGGRETTVAADRVAEIDSAWHPAEREADALFQQRRFDEALDRYRAALGAERRRWVQQRLVAGTVRCYQRLDQVVPAVQSFLALVRDDPQTPYFDAIPLCWLPVQPAPTVEREAQAWLGSDEPAAQLLGASWLLATRERPAAAAGLARLAAAPALNAQLRGLAAAQAWRTRVATAGPEEVARWQSAVASLPRELQAGPYFLIGQALARGGQPDQAALALLRVPILYPDQSQLAAEALLAAAGQLKSAGHAAEAEALLRELVARHADTTAADQARAQLERPAP